MYMYMLDFPVVRYLLDETWLKEKTHAKHLL